MGENQALIDGLVDELKLRRYSAKTIKKYSQTISSFLGTKKDARSFLLSYCDKSKSTMRGVYFALKFFLKMSRMRNSARKCLLQRNHSSCLRY